MNARIKEKRESQFRPFTLEIDVNNIDEANYLLSILNPPAEKANRYNDFAFDPQKVQGEDLKVFSAIRKHLNQQENN